eukprot:CAMPEP_0194486494 /NCGR_PEP_ID=MMETSP0253-20130528/7119_1 /TAXON_ID=2966 /ORGANISM="Noctiluca scintillans" /LENGTH=186 /DNA_ID=CAMNT_0039326589 /DNA_START=43 /DNA_END=603 /DNA_ORIENTATION=-
MARNDKYARMGDLAFARMEKVNADLLIITYGSIVTQLIRDIEDIDEVNKELEKMGYNIGLRIVDEFLAKSGVSACHNFTDTAEIIAKVGLRMFLGVSAEVLNWNTAGTACSLSLSDNPLAEYVDLPPEHSKLCYSNLLCGVFRGALEQLQMSVKCWWEKDILRGDDRNLIRLEFQKFLIEEYEGDD